jgi:5-methylcytosine-specific restriction endonuclease McrA
MASTFICEECPRVLECIVCGAHFLDSRKGRRGRCQRFCSEDHRREWAASRYLRLKADGRSPYRDPCYSANRYAQKEPTVFKCQTCERPFESRQIRAKYCSTDCMAKGVAGVLTKRHGTRPPRPCEKCGEIFKPARPNRRQREAGYIQRHCSYECAGMVPRTVRPKRGDREKRLRSTGYWHPVDPMIVFDRDGWRCHLCGIRTPKHLRGTTDDRAPECDHIVPIAAGGSHSYENSACSCRKCNRQKGAKPLGQLLLFG